MGRETNKKRPLPCLREMEWIKEILCKSKPRVESQNPEFVDL